ncbi:MAG TPA: hypothetical protein VGH77_26235 [Streptosporangiaceae bacterium]
MPASTGFPQQDGTWWINNTGFLVGPQGVISIGACSTERRIRAYQAAAALGDMVSYNGGTPLSCLA